MTREDLPLQVSQRLEWLDEALRGVHRSEAEQAALVWLAGHPVHIVRALAALFSRARAARSFLVPDEAPAPPQKPRPGRPKGAAG